jgi:hypothetical protein
MITSAVFQGSNPHISGVDRRNSSTSSGHPGRVGIISCSHFYGLRLDSFRTWSTIIDLAWPDIRQRKLPGKSLIGCGYDRGIYGVVGLSCCSNHVANLITIEEIYQTSFADLDLFRLFSSLLSFVTSFLLFLALYYWVPNTNLPFGASFWGAIVSYCRPESSH